ERSWHRGNPPWKARHGDPRAVSRRIPEPSRAEVRHLSLRIRRVGRTQKGTEYSFTPNESGREKAEAGESAPRPTRVRYKSYAETAADPADRDSEPGGPGGHCFATNAFSRCAICIRKW